MDRLRSKAQENRDELKKFGAKAFAKEKLEKAKESAERGKGFFKENFSETNEEFQKTFERAKSIHNQDAKGWFLFQKEKLKRRSETIRYQVVGGSGIAAYLATRSLVFSAVSCGYAYWVLFY